MVGICAIGIEGLIGPDEKKGVFLPEVLDRMDVTRRDIEEGPFFLAKRILESCLGSKFP